jgi:threonine dehydrogenase-like Zn-dependent dehydrogenase
MKAVTFKSKGVVEVKTVTVPQIQEDTDAIIEVYFNKVFLSRNGAFTRLST